MFSACGKDTYPGSSPGIYGTYGCTCYIKNLGYGDMLLSSDTIEQDIVVERFNQSQDTAYLNSTMMVKTLSEPHPVFSVPSSSFRYQHEAVFFLEQDSLKVYFYRYWSKSYYCYGVK